MLCSPRVYYRHISSRERGFVTGSLPAGGSSEVMAQTFLSVSLIADNFVRNMCTTFRQENAMRNPRLILKSLIFHRVLSHESGHVWAPHDFLDLGSRGAIDKALQRSVATGELRRVDRGLYDKPHRHALTGLLAAPGYRSVIDAVSRQDQVRVLMEGMTPANALDLTHAVPARVVVLTDARLRRACLSSATPFPIDSSGCWQVTSVVC